MAKLNITGIAALTVLGFGALSCADEALMSDAGAVDDGSIRFSVYDNGVKVGTRAAEDSYLSWNHVGSRLNVFDGDSIWCHIGVVDNSSAADGVTRSLPRHTADLSTLHVSAYIDGTPYMNNVAITEQGGYWGSETKYYWPEESLDFYSLADDALSPLSFSDLDIDHTSKKVAFSYAVPTASGDMQGKDAEVQPDLLLAHTSATRRTTDQGKAHLQFRHPLAGIYVDKGTDLDEYEITNLKLKGLYGEGDCVFESKSLNYPFEWEVKGSKKEYSQAADGDHRASFSVNGTDASGLAEPFMVIPQTVGNDFALEVTINGIVKEIPLNDAFPKLDAGKIYKIMLTKGDAQYPPVRNEQGMAGNNTVSLTWLYPDPTVLEPYPHVHQIGVYFEVEQVRTEGEAEVEKCPTKLTKKVYWPGWENSEYPASSLLDLFADIKEGVDEDGNTVKIDTKKYNRFKVKIYAAYLNETDPSFVNEGEIPEVHLSTPVSLTINRVTSKARIAFFLPHNFDTDGKTPWEYLLDDDDKAAAEWFKETFEDGVFVNASNLATKQEQYGFEVIWFPCGVHLSGGDPTGDNLAHEYDFWLSKGAYIMNKMDLSRTDVPFIDFFLHKRIPSPRGYKYYNDECPECFLPFGVETPERNDLENFNNLDRYDAIFKEHICKWKNLYNAPYPGITEDGVIRHYDGEYVTKADTDALKTFYENGGSLLLTTFALEKVADIGVFGWVPETDMFNEVKQPAVWFVNPLMDGNDRSSHPIYEGLFSVDPIAFKDVYLSDFIDGNNDGKVEMGVDDKEENYKHRHAGEDAVPYFLAGIVGRKMIPLLSNDAESCENNNCIWNSNSDVAYDGYGGMVLGTWGQRRNTDDKAIVEFKDKTKGRNNGRCICIGLGAYEFNNGSKYVHGAEVKNNYQSNVHQLTKNALEYLMTPKKWVKE